MIDVYRYLAQYLSDKDRFYLMITSKDMEKLDLTFDQEHPHIKIFKSSFYHNFTNVAFANEIHYMNHIMPWPKKLNRLYYAHQGNSHIRYKKFENVTLPTTITQIIFGPDFNGYIKCDIPTSVTYVRFGHIFNQPLKCLAPSIIHLSLDGKYDHSIKDATSITHLTITGVASKFNFNNISTFITHLIISDMLQCLFKYTIPSTIINLTFKKPIIGDNCYASIPSTIKEIYFLDNIYIKENMEHIRNIINKNIKIFFPNAKEKID